MEDRSSKARILDVVNRSQRIGRSSFYESTRRVSAPAPFRVERVYLDRGTYSDAAAVVLDLQQLETAFLDRDPD